jgi:hypothetical protein
MKYILHLATHVRIKVLIRKRWPVSMHLAMAFCDMQRSKGVRLIVNDDYTDKYIIQILNQFDQDIPSRQRQTDEQFKLSNCFHRSHSQPVREKESNSHESIQESASQATEIE